MTRRFAFVQAACVLALLAFPVLASAASDIPVEEIPDRIQQKYEGMQSFAADFEQVLTNVSSGQVETRSGRIWFRQPSQLRWATEAPARELFIIGPEFAWEYIEDEQVALKHPVSAFLNSKTMLRFLSGQANLKEDFVIHSDWKDSDRMKTEWGQGVVMLELVPKEPEMTMMYAFLGVDPETALLKRIMIVDFYGNGNEVRLSDVKTDVDIAEDMFQFTPPEGVDVEDNTLGY